MLAALSHAVHIAFGNDPTMMQDNETVSVTAIEERPDGRGLAIEGESDVINCLMGAWQWHRWTGSSPNRGGRDNFADMLEAPTIPGCAVPIFAWQGYLTRDSIGYKSRRRHAVSPQDWLQNRTRRGAGLPSIAGSPGT